MRLITLKRNNQININVGTIKSSWLKFLSVSSNLLH